MDFAAKWRQRICTLLHRQMIHFSILCMCEKKPQSNHIIMDHFKPLMKIFTITKYLLSKFHVYLTIWNRLNKYKHKKEGLQSLTSEINSI